MNKFGGDFAWWPTPELMAQSNLQAFMNRHGIASLGELQTRSTDDIAWFWTTVLNDLKIEFFRPYEKILDLSAGMPWARWCVGGEMNIVHNCLDRYAGSAVADRDAVRWEGEESATRSMTYDELRMAVNRAANGLRKLGLKKGDAVGVFMPMMPETVIAMMAIIKIGGIFLPLFSGYGAQAIVSRLRFADAKALITADGFFRRGKLVAMKTVADEVAAELPLLSRVIVVRRTGAAVPFQSGRDYWWHDLVDRESTEAETERTSAEDPLMILYTSGTTGAPKGAVHTHCGFPIKAAQDMSHGLDVHEDETIFWFTDLGWMMGPWLIFGTLLLGATMMLYDGAPDFPEPDRLWDLVERHRITTLGISPTLVRALIAHGTDIVKKHDLSSLRKFASTGEPWNPEPWMWLFKNAGGGRLPIINYSGGTEISGGILTGNVLTPLKPGGFAGPCPGMAADVVDESGNSVRGEVGELVIRQPWIGMTRGFWKAPERYVETYWSRFENVWVHGDWAAVDADGQWFILGRSDDTIKIGGKRLGPAEVESVLVNNRAVKEAAAIGVPDPIKGEVLVCFCVLKNGDDANSALALELTRQVGEALGKPMRPARVEFVRDLPKTRNAKVMRRLLRGTFLGEKLGDISALENPDALAEIKLLTKQ